MKDLTPRPLEWVDEAPMAVQAEADSTADPAAVFAVLADHGVWPEWFPNVRRVEVIGPAEGVGARRRVRVPGLVVEEEFIAWDPGVRWAFTGLRARPGFTRSLIEDCRLTARPDGGTHITYSMYLDPPPFLRPLVRAARPALRSTLRRGTAALAARAAR